MKIKITLLIIIVVGGFLSSQAQQGAHRTAEERTKFVVERLSDSLKLSKAQQGDVDSVYLQYYKAQDKLRENLTPGTRPERADLEKLFETRDAKLKVILKEDQYNKLKSMEAAMRQRGPLKPAGQ